MGSTNVPFKVSDGGLGITEPFQCNCCDGVSYQAHSKCVMEGMGSRRYT